MRTKNDYFFRVGRCLILHSDSNIQWGGKQNPPNQLSSDNMNQHNLLPLNVGICRYNIYKDKSIYLVGYLYFEVSNMTLHQNHEYPMFTIESFIYFSFTHEFEFNGRKFMNLYLNSL